jgi:uncharacterized membrane protein
METTDKIPQQPKKKINDFVWVAVGLVGLIAVLVLLKYAMHQFHVI